LFLSLSFLLFCSWIITCGEVAIRGGSY
jgi:hypothetical protein